MLAIARNIFILFFVGLTFLLAACSSETQPLPDVDATVQEKTEETAKVVDTATPLPTATAAQTLEKTAEVEESAKVATPAPIAYERPWSD